MSDLILQTRVGLLRRNLERVRDAAQDIEDGRNELADLQASAKGALRALEDVQDSTRKARRALRSNETNVLSGELANLDQLTNDLETNLDGLKRTADAMESAVPFSGGLKMLEEETNKELKILEGLERQLAAGANGGALGAAWLEYSSRLFGESQQIFGEYVDFLGGLALREAGFVNQNVYMLADELVRQSAKLFRIEWTSLSIPARREALGRTTARIIRLGFPEWTIWALPLTAHELGHVLAEDASDLSEPVKAANEVDGRHAPILVADAIASCAMGPAYASAAILMRLDPWRAFSEEEGALVAKRAEAILWTTERMSTESEGQPYGKIVEQLRTEWRAALEQTGEPAELSDEDKAGVVAVIEGVAAVTALKFSRGEEVWSVVVDWAQALEDGKPDVAELALEGELRDVLNAAWIARLEKARKGERGSATVDDIARHAMTLWARIKNREDAVSPGASAADRPSVSASAGAARVGVEPSHS